ncbi:hypothetical protein BRADI_1g24141v3 [Brachypodium distachyon]|uniref:Uncharacterized protein n=1 Tax=Brachypodium distachyon TaxID=15368 RepID=A0A2K2DKT7_BRADI|nr:hypothetical protein BRADI_1g24141v3 [Brachypodium distachyon]
MAGWLLAVGCRGRRATTPAAWTASSNARTRLRAAGAAAARRGAHGQARKQRRVGRLGRRRAGRGAAAARNQAMRGDAVKARGGGPAAPREAAGADREQGRRRLAWPLRKDDTHKSRNGPNFFEVSHTGPLIFFSRPSQPDTIL